MLTFFFPPSANTLLLSDGHGNKISYGVVVVEGFGIHRFALCLLLVNLLTIEGKGLFIRQLWMYWVMVAHRCCILSHEFTGHKVVCL